MLFKTFGVKIDGTSTDVVLSNYQNKLLIVITQTKKFGSIVRVEKEIFQASDTRENVFNIQTIFGHENDENALFARILCEKIETTKPVVLIINLQNHSPRTVKALVRVVNENKIW